MKKLSAIVLLTVLVSCGKGELVGDAVNIAEKAITDATSTAGKAIEDTWNEGDRTSNKVITDVNDAKNTLLSNTGNFTESIGDAGEVILQAPRKIGNALLGTDQNTDEELKDLEQLVSELRQEFWNEFSDYKEEMRDLEQELREADSTNENSISVLQADLEATEAQLMDEIANVKEDTEENRQRIRNVKQKLRNLRSRVSRLSQRISNLRSTFNSLNSQVNDIEYNQDQLSTSVSTNAQAILELQGKVVSEVIDPCGDKPNHFDEVLIQLGDGKIIAYFEVNGKRFLSTLENGKAYRTTDNQSCDFRVENNKVCGGQTGVSCNN